MCLRMFKILGHVSSENVGTNVRCQYTCCQALGYDYLLLSHALAEDKFTRAKDRKVFVS